MRRRLVTWFALFAMLAGLAVPAHAYTHPRAPDGMPADFCTTRPAPAAPAVPTAPHATTCDACASCTPAGAPSASQAQPVIATDGPHALRAASPAAATLRQPHFDARAPPPLR